LLQNIEKLTLYIIELKEENETQQKVYQELKNEIDKLKNIIRCDFCVPRAIFNKIITIFGRSIQNQYRHASTNNKTSIHSRIAISSRVLHVDVNPAIRCAAPRRSYN
jgi:predicted DNA repair protein MutK